MARIKFAYSFAALAALAVMLPVASQSADGTIRIMEAELMRLVGAVLDCPLPPLLTELDPASLAA